MAKELYNYCVNKPEIPDVAMSFSKPDVKAYVDRNVQRTENIKFNASSQQKITMDLPKGVRVRCVETGVVYKTITQAAKETGASQAGIRGAASGMAGGYRWEYVDD